MESEKLIEALGALGLNTDGTLQQRGERLILSKQAGLEKKHSLMEAKVNKLCNLLDETIKRTKQKVEKRQALAFGEMEEEEVHTEPETGLDDDYYNPLNRAMGVQLRDMWERKLWGEEGHLKKWCHRLKLRRLGIQETEKFNGITSIEEAKELSGERMPKRQRLIPPRPLDADGNVGPVLADQETEKKSSNQVPSGVVIPPQDIKSVVKRTARILSIKDSEFERKMIDMYGNRALFKMFEEL
ncbi:unnamed protein product [Arabis nemorensis]|uniref:Uncharacterized protein n=1 Tax=Arabis nemorensis TaxID=586526 RepID=A0A565CHA1_9BRAS|nr:unnamed protein product [Arabis nemorensis]